MKQKGVHIFFAYKRIDSLKLQVQPSFLSILFILFSFAGKAQTDTTDKIYQGIILDEVMIKAVQGGFDIPSFIDKVKKDTTFYKAFKTLHLLSYTMYNDIEIYDTDEETKASYNSITRQESIDGCRSMSTQQEKIRGNFFKRNHEFKYYTAKLYAHLFSRRTPSAANILL